MSYQNILQQILDNPSKIFLIDGIGATLSAFLLGVVLVNFESAFGMPKQILYYLAIGACILAVCSYSCFFFNTQKWNTYLKIIASANLLYCSTTLILVILFFGELTVLGKLYFVSEIGIILFLVKLEFEVATKTKTY